MLSFLASSAVSSLFGSVLFNSLERSCSSSSLSLYLLSLKCSPSDSGGSSSFMFSRTGFYWLIGDELIVNYRHESQNLPITETYNILRFIIVLQTLRQIKHIVQWQFLLFRNQIVKNQCVQAANELIQDKRLQIRSVIAWFRQDFQAIVPIFQCLAGLSDSRNKFFAATNWCCWDAQNHCYVVAAPRIDGNKNKRIVERLCSRSEIVNNQRQNNKNIWMLRVCACNDGDSHDSSTVVYTVKILPVKSEDQTYWRSLLKF